MLSGRTALTIRLIVALIGFLPFGSAVADPNATAAILESVLAKAGPTVRIDGYTAERSVLTDFYESHDYAPIWIEGDGPGPRYAALADVLAGAARDGLDPDDYRLPDSADYEGDVLRLADLELIASATLIHYGMDLNNGRVTPRQADPDHFTYHRDLDPAGLLEGASLAPDLADYLKSIAPPSIVYRGLRRALAEYRRLEAAGGWGEIADGPSLKPGMRDPRVSDLRRQLQQTGDLTIVRDDSDLYDDGLVLAVESFQRRHGLTDDGVVGPKTRTALNVPVADRIRQILLNMERWRWMPPFFGDTHVFVNMAGFELDYVEYGSVDLRMRVIVGKPYRQTPVFSGQISYLEVNPYWTVPYSIATKDILPKAKNDASYLVNKGIRVFTGGAEVDAYAVDWHALGRGNFPFTLRQDPGRANALGRVKFMFPNRHSVYLHDTPSRALFARTVRTFSSGCIRVEKPVNLAAKLLQDSGWTAERITSAITSGNRKVIRLEIPVPVHLSYVTAWAGEGGSINFRDDIYGRDARLSRALFGKPS